MSNHIPTDVSPELLTRHKTGWHNFMRAATYGIVGVVIVLSLMALFLTH